MYVGNSNSIQILFIIMKVQNYNITHIRFLRLLWSNLYAALQLSLFEKNTSSVYKSSILMTGTR